MSSFKRIDQKMGKVKRLKQKNIQVNYKGEPVYEFPSHSDMGTIRVRKQHYIALPS